MACGLDVAGLSVALGLAIAQTALAIKRFRKRMKQFQNLHEDWIDGCECALRTTKHWQKTIRKNHHKLSRSEQSLLREHLRRATELIERLSRSLVSLLERDAQWIWQRMNTQLRADEVMPELQHITVNIHWSLDQIAHVLSVGLNSEAEKYDESEPEPSDSEESASATFVSEGDRKDSGVSDVSSIQSYNPIAEIQHACGTLNYYAVLQLLTNDTSGTLQHARDQYGRTLLDLAICQGSSVDENQVYIAHLLRERGVNFTMSNHKHAKRTYADVKKAIAARGWTATSRKNSKASTSYSTA